MEGSLVDPNRSHTVLRGSKVLAQTNWILRNFRLIYTSHEEVLASLDRAHVGLVLVQNDSSRPDFVQLRSALAEDLLDWLPVNENTSLHGVTVYSRVR